MFLVIKIVTLVNVFQKDLSVSQFNLLHQVLDVVQDQIFNKFHRKNHIQQEV